MIDIAVEGLSKYYGANRVLEGLSFQIQAGEHVGMLGKNGAGKTTVFRILCGQERYDEGRVSVAQGHRLGLLSQIPEAPPALTAGEALAQAFAPLYAMHDELESLARQMERDDDAGLVRRYGDLQHRLEAGGWFEIDTRIARVRAGLGITDALCAQRFESLSGGEQTRVHLARLILEETDILLLDEPTNHLDMRACEWLEEYLSRYRGTVICISHDRYFLDSVVSRIIEIRDGRAELYSGNYSFYAVEKHAREQEQRERWEREQREMGRLLDTARRMHDYAGKNAKLHRRAFAMEKRAQRLKSTDKPMVERKMSTHFQQTQFSADDVLRVSDVSKGYGDRTVLDDLRLRVGPRESIALLGDNGAGKTTLFKLLMGEEAPDAGRVMLGPSVKPGYLPQVVEFAHPGRTLVDTLLYEVDIPPGEARNRLGAFRFTGDDVFKRVEDLSGGERSRLKLCLLMREEVNLLLLDEPTNHLDLASREWMEEAVAQYEEALLFISHDRYFISQFATRIWVLEKGKILDFQGTYEEYTQYRTQQEALARADAEPPPRRAGHSGKMGSKKKDAHPGGASQAVEAELHALEAHMTELDAAMAESATDAQRLAELYEERGLLERRWEERFAQWEALSGQS